MKRSLCIATLAAACSLLTLGMSPRPAHADAFSVMHTFTGIDGAYPFSGLLLENDTLYGVTEQGGPGYTAASLGWGTIYSINKDTSAFSSLYTFTGTEGGLPSSTLVRDSNGNLFGTTYGGGPNNYGTIFRFSPDSKLTVLHTFYGTDGALPVGGLAIDGSGSLFGATQFGGASFVSFGSGEFGYGVVFKQDSKGDFKVLHSFEGGYTDGTQPYSSPMLDGKGNLYGTTIYGGDAGVIYKVTSRKEYRVFHIFNVAEGLNGFGGLVHDKAGNLYGTNSNFGANQMGTVYRISPEGNVTVLHNFTGADGASPRGGLILDTAGNLYGTTTEGGASGHGTVFKLTPQGSLTTLHAFTGGADGGTPYNVLVRDKNGVLYGTTLFGGVNNLGVVFKITPEASGKEK